jgi:3-deoxy-D-manno-octulosonic-acid transferase
MRLLYNIGIRLYWLVAGLMSLWNRKAKLWITGRRNWYSALQGAIKQGDRVIWFHCASLGEFEQGRPVIEAVRERFPAHRIVLSFFSPSGYEKRKDYPGVDYVMYLPLDTRRNARRMVELLSPELVFFIKYEFWYHFLKQLKLKQVPVYLASGNFRSDQLFFKWYGGWYRKILDAFSHIFVQKEDSRLLLEQIGYGRVTVAGDTRFDRVSVLRTSEYAHPVLEAFAGGATVIVAGSTWEKDEQLLAHAYNELKHDLRWIIAPHELSKEHIASLQKRFPDSVLFSELKEELPPGTRVVIVDSIGQLSSLYRYGTLAYIGGGFGKGIHNILEAATYALPVLFGPRYEKFSEAVELVAHGGARPVNSEEELLFIIHEQLKNPKLLKTTSEISGTFVLERVGATSAILNFVLKKTKSNLP